MPVNSDQDKSRLAAVTETDGDAGSEDFAASVDEEQDLHSQLDRSSQESDPEVVAVASRKRAKHSGPARRTNRRTNADIEVESP